MPLCSVKDLKNKKKERDSSQPKKKKNMETIPKLFWKRLERMNLAEVRDFRQLKKEQESDEEERIIIVLVRHV